MADIKEKMVELLNAIDGVCPKDASCYDCEYKDVVHCAIPAKADFLIAHGVTVQEWISVKDRLPEKSTDVLICNIEEYIGTDFLTNDGKWFWNEELPPTHWMPLPQPPKGE